LAYTVFTACFNLFPVVVLVQAQETYPGSREGYAGAGTAAAAAIDDGASHLNACSSTAAASASLHCRRALVCSAC